MPEPQDSQPVTPPDPRRQRTTRPSNIWEFLTAFWQESRHESVMAGMAALTALVTGNRDLRELVMAAGSRGQVWVRRQYNWTVNNIIAAVNAFVDGQLIQAVLGIVALTIAAQIQDWELKAKALAIVAGLDVVLVAIVYGFVANVALRIGLVIGAFTDEEVAAFKLEGGTSIIRLLFSGARGGVDGGLKSLWVTSKKCARSILWFTVGCMYLGFLPFYRIPGLLWLASPSIILFVVLHVLVEKDERGVEWSVCHNVSLVMLFLVIPAFLILPETFQWLTVPLGVANSFWIRLATLGLAFWGMNVILQKSREAHAAHAAASTSKTPPAAPAKWGFKESMGVAIVLVMVMLTMAVYHALKEGSDGFTRANGTGSVNNFIVSHPSLNKSWANQIAEGNPNTTNGALPVNMTGRDAGRGASTSAALVGSENISGVQVDTLVLEVTTHDIDLGIRIKDGEDFQVEVLDGNYGFRRLTLNAAGTMEGHTLIPAHNPSLFGEDYRYLVDPRQPVGVLFVRPGLGSDPAVVGTGATIQSHHSVPQRLLPSVFKSGDRQLSAILNIPQGPQFERDAHGTIKLVVRRNIIT